MDLNKFKDLIRLSDILKKDHYLDSLFQTF
jgi:hypothetical protein